MAEGEMRTLVVDETVGAQAIGCLLGTLPVFLKGSNIGYLLNISGKGGRIAAFLFLELLRCRIVYLFIFFVSIIDDC